MNKTPLFDSHQKLNARIIDFSGWLMPVQYSSIIDEHVNTRKNVSIFDTCHMGELLISGKDAGRFMQDVFPADLDKLKHYQAKYTFLFTEEGTVVDDLIFFIMENEFLLCVNAGNISNVYNNLMNLSVNYDINILNKSDFFGKIDVQGPKASVLISEFVGGELPKRFRFIKSKLNSFDIILSRTGYTGEDGFELFFNAEYSSDIWNDLLEKGKKYGIMPAGLGARDSLRLEACYPLYGHELSESITPLEADLGFALDFQTTFYAKNVLEKKSQTGLKTKLFAFEMLTKGIPRSDYDILYKDKKIGYVSSGTYSPTFGKGLGLAFLDTNVSKIGLEIDVDIRNKLHKAVIVNKPIYNFGGKNQ
jgi:aminomethyltransferase